MFHKRQKLSKGVSGRTPLVHRSWVDFLPHLVGVTSTSLTEGERIPLPTHDTSTYYPIPEA